MLMCRIVPTYEESRHAAAGNQANDRNASILYTTYIYINTICVTATEQDQFNYCN